MLLDKLLQRALAVSPLALTVEALTFSARLIPRVGKLATAPSKRWSSGVLERSGAASAGHNISLEDWFNRTDCQWFAEIEIGTPAQYVTVALGTTPMPLLVPANNCTTCSNIQKFHPGNSTTFKPGDGNATRFEYSRGPNPVPLSRPLGARCYLNNDTVGFGDLRVDSQSFLLCDDYDPLFNEMRPAGFLGLDTYDPNVPAKTLLWNLWESGKLDNPIFSIYMPTGRLKSGRLTLGGLDPSKYTGDIHYVRLHLDVDGMTGGAWIAALDAVWANDLVLGNSSNSMTPLKSGYAIFDTGTAFIQTPDNATAAALYAQISPEFGLIDPAGAWGALCKHMKTLAPALTFVLGEGLDARNFTIPAQNFNLGPYPTRKGYCQAVFNSPLAPVHAPDGKPVWVLGSPFLKNFYSVWNGLEKKIGFADLVRTAEAEPSQPPTPP